MPYLEKSFEETFKLINYPQEDIRKASIDALVQFCINFSKINSNDGRAALLKALSMFIPKLAELIRLDEEQTVAISGLEAYSELLKSISSDVSVGEGHKDAIMNCVIDVMRGIYNPQLYSYLVILNWIQESALNCNFHRRQNRVSRSRGSRGYGY